MNWAEAPFGSHELEDNFGLPVSWAGMSESTENYLILLYVVCHIWQPLGELSTHVYANNTLWLLQKYVRLIVYISYVYSKNDTSEEEVNDKPLTGLFLNEL